MRRSVTTATYVAPARETLGEYFDGWVAALPTRLRPSTVDSYARCLKYVRPSLGGRRLDQVTASDLDALYAALLASGKRQSDGGLSPRSVRYVHTVVRKCLADAVKKGDLARNVADAADPPRAKDTKAPEMAWWSPEELRTFLTTTADEPVYGPLFRVAALSGLRRGEVCGLLWSDVDLDAGRLEVRHQLLVVRTPGATNGGLMFSEVTKTDKGRRTVDLDAGTVAVLKAHKRRQAQDRLAMGAGWQADRPYVFTEADGRPVDPESVAQVFARRVLRSGLPRIRFHDLRHSHCSHLIEAGESPLLVSRRLGHASPAFTLSRYGHLFPEAGSEAASRVGAMVDGSHQVSGAQS